MTAVFHRHLSRQFPVAVSGKGVRLTDSEGREYIDASGGAAVSCLGHGHPDILAAMHAQIDKLAYAHTSFFTTEVAEELAANLIRQAPAGISHAYFVSGGSEGVEAALKMARQGLSRRSDAKADTVMAVVFCDGGERYLSERFWENPPEGALIGGTN